MKSFALLLASVSLVATVLSKKDCFDFQVDDNGHTVVKDSNFTFTSQSGVLKVNGARFNMKAASWFGFETSNNVVHGLWAQDYKFLIDFLASYSFNAMRLPFSCDLVLGGDSVMPDSINYYNMNEDLKDLNSMQVLDKIIEYSAEVGIMIMLDMHSLEVGGYMQDGLWYNDNYSSDTVLSVWKTLVDRYKNQWNVIAMDVFNEPFDATWGTGNTDTDFNTWCETAGNYVHSAGADWLIMCEGTGGVDPTCADACFWGENLQGVASHPVKLNVANKLVYCPHVYGPQVAHQDYFDASNFPDNMPDIWHTHWGFVRELNDAAITIGEWGGTLDGANGEWMNEFVSYLQDIDSPDQWFWCLNPDSGDTGGLLLYDWQTPETTKLNLLEKLMPNPTKIGATKHGRNRLTVCTE